MKKTGQCKVIGGEWKTNGLKKKMLFIYYTLMCSVSFPDPLSLPRNTHSLSQKDVPPPQLLEDWPAPAAALLHGSQRILAD